MKLMFWENHIFPKPNRIIHLKKYLSTYTRALMYFCKGSSLTNAGPILEAALYF